MRFEDPGGGGGNLEPTTGIYCDCLIQEEAKSSQ